LKRIVMNGPSMLPQKRLANGQTTQPFNRQAYVYLLTQGYCRFVKGQDPFKFTFDLKHDDLQTLLSLLSRIHNNANISTRALDDALHDVWHYCHNFKTPTSLLYGKLPTSVLVKQIYSLWDQGCIQRKEWAIESLLNSGLSVVYPLFLFPKDEWLAHLIARTLEIEVEIYEMEDPDVVVEWIVTDVMAFAIFLHKRGWVFDDVDLAKKWFSLVVEHGSSGTVASMMENMASLMPFPIGPVTLMYSEWENLYIPDNHLFIWSFNMVRREEIVGLLDQNVASSLKIIISMCMCTEFPREILHNWITGTSTTWMSSSYDVISERLNREPVFAHFLIDSLRKVLMLNQAQTFSRLALRLFCERRRIRSCNITPQLFRQYVTADEFNSLKQQIKTQCVAVMLADLIKRAAMVAEPGYLDLLLTELKTNYDAHIGPETVNSWLSTMENRRLELVVCEAEQDDRNAARHLRVIERLSKSVKVASRLFREDFIAACRFISGKETDEQACEFVLAQCEP
jgi:hypothetical protein